MTDFLTACGIKNRLGFGCMRLPVLADKTVDDARFSQMIDYFMARGCNYFDTAPIYHGGDSEAAIGRCLAARYSRDAFVLTDKLSTSCFETEAEIRPLFEKQLARCGVSYFDFYFMHAQDRSLFEKYKACRAYETALELKKEGKIKHLGISFHDKAAVLAEILAAYPEIELVQLQFNYLDFEDPIVESRLCLEICEKFGKPVAVMGPVKGGRLADLPEDAKRVVEALDSGSPSSLAIRFAASFPSVAVVLSGMGSLDMVRENVDFMLEFKPLDRREREAVDTIVALLRGKEFIPCTTCNYCTVECPVGVKIPDIIACLNAAKASIAWNARHAYGLYTEAGGKGSDCLACGACEAVCPQHLAISDLMAKAAAEFEKK
ncbi:MAG: aldo/keto reductase [Clostridia bacterium]|nr:aldo/keto reductase [Clostridia bacterium]